MPLLSMLLLLIPFADAIGQRKPAGGRASQNYVWLFNYQGKLQRLFPLQQPVPDYKNRQFHIAVSDQQGRMLQVNGIDENWLKDTVIKNAPVQVVLIGKVATYTVNPQRSKTILTITCPERLTGKPVSIHVQTILFTAKHKPMRVDSRLHATLPDNQMIITDINKPL